MVSKSVSTADGHAMVRRWIHDNNFTCKTNGLASAVTGDFKGTPKVPKQIAAMMPAVQPQLSPHPSKMDVGIVLFWVDKAAIDVVYSVVVDYSGRATLRKVSRSATIKNKCSPSLLPVLVIQFTTEKEFKWYIPPPDFRTSNWQLANVWP